MDRIMSDTTGYRGKTVCVCVCAAAPLLRTERARRDWLEKELDLCNQSYEYRRVIEGEVAQVCVSVCV